MSITIDAHQHYWELGRFDYSWLDTPELSKIRRSFLPNDLQPLIAETSIQKTIFVQTQHNVEENRWALGLCEQHDFIAGVVGWVDLAAENCEDQLLEFKSHPKFVGIRHVTQDEPDDEFIIRPEIIRGLKVLEKHNVPFDLLFYVKHLKHAATLGQQFPNLPMVIDHLAKPEIKAGNIENWIKNFKAAAACENIYCKLSGMITEADWEHWSANDLKPYVQTALELFGPDRLMFGSDWPVCELAGSYNQVHAALIEAIGPISDDEREKIFGSTAASFYGLDV
jgi:L-fuconolactonase